MKQTSFTYHVDGTSDIREDHDMQYAVQQTWSSNPAVTFNGLTLSRVPSYVGIAENKPADVTDLHITNLHQDLTTTIYLSSCLSKGIITSPKK